MSIINIPTYAQDPILDDTLGLRIPYHDAVDTFNNLPHYQYDLTLTADFDQASLAGRGEILYTNITNRALNEIVLRLYANLQTFGGAAEISNVTVNGEPVSPTLDPTLSVVGVPLPVALLPDQQITLAFDYETIVYFGRTRLYHQYSYLETELALASALPLLSVYEDTGWWRETIHAYGDAVHSESAFFDVTITAPAYLKLITSGTETGSQTNGEWITHTYHAPLMRDFAIMASSQYQTLSGTYQDIAIEVHYLPGGESTAPLVLQYTQDSLAAFSTQFGYYPYTELDVVETWTAAGGIEYPGLIVISDDLWTPTARFLEWVTVHEVAHQWWYSMVGSDQTRHPWLDEALTEYSISIYQEYLNGAAGYAETVDTYIRWSQGYEQALQSIGDAPSAFPDESAYGAIVYRQGALFFHQLRQQLGDVLFFQALQSYLDQYRYGVATPDDLQTIFSSVAGMDLTPQFLAVQ